MPSFRAKLTSSDLSESQLEYLLNNLPPSLVAVAFGVAAIVVVFQGVVEPALLYGWTAVAILVALFRFGVYIWLKNNMTHVLAKRLIFLSATATGLLWGAASILFCMQTDMFYWVFLAFFMSGYASGAVFSTSALLPACAGYFFPTILPITVWFFLQEDSRAALMGVLLLAFTFAAWNMAKNAHRFLIEKVEAQTQLQLAQQEITAKNEKVQALQTMAGGIAHDFNNILAGITGNLYMAQHEPHISPKLARYLRTIDEGVSKAGNISRKMLEYSRSGQLANQSIDVEQLLRERAMHMQQQGVDTVCHIEAELPVLHGDIAQFGAVLDSLIFNAHESYGSEAGVVSIAAGQSQALVFEDEQYQSSQHDGAWLHIVVRDSGCGMNEETIRHVFEPFFTTKFTGRGLGMSVVYGVVQRMGGQIRIQSMSGQGTSISLYLPVTGDSSHPGAALQASC